MDADTDGKVAREGCVAAHPQMTEGAFKAITGNADGAIRQEEWKAFAAGHKSSGHRGAQNGGMGGSAPKGETPANGTGATQKEPMPSLIMPPGVGK